MQKNCSDMIRPVDWGEATREANALKGEKQGPGQEAGGAYREGEVINSL